MNYCLFDLHCDTAHKIRKLSTNLQSKDLHVRLNDIKADKYVQTMAIWSPHELSDEECWQNFLDTYSNLKDKLDLFGEKIIITTDSEAVKSALDNGKYPFILAVEGARLLSGDLKKLDTLREMGVRFMTLTWKGECSVGGAFDTDLPLTDFGVKAVRRMYEIGIIPDISHASINTAKSVADIADELGKPFIATHSNSRVVYDHERNLTPELFSRLVLSGGVVGISFCPKHICDETKEECNVDAVMRHIDYYLSNGGEKALCLGCDYDGIDHTPRGLENNSLMGNLADAMIRHGYSEETVNNVFFGNAMAFIERNL